MKGDSTMTMYKNMRKVNRKDHEYHEGDFMLMDNEFYVLHGYKLYAQTFTKSIATMPYKLTYMIPDVIRDDVHSYEHMCFEAIENRYAKLNYVNANKTTGKQVGHVYMTKNHEFHLYLGKAKVVNTETLETVIGHVYVWLGLLFHMRNMRYGTIDLQQAVVNEVNKRMVISDDTVVFKNDNAEDRGIMLDVYQNRLRDCIDVADVNGLTADKLNLLSGNSWRFNEQTATRTHVHSQITSDKIDAPLILYRV